MEPMGKGAMRLSGLSQGFGREAYRGSRGSVSGLRVWGWEAWLGLTWLRVLRV